MIKQQNQLLSLPTWRAQLYGDMTHSLYEVRQSVAENVVKMKQRLGLQGSEQTPPSGNDAMVTALKGESTKVIQEENAQLNKMVHIKLWFGESGLVICMWLTCDLHVI